LSGTAGRICDENSCRPLICEHPDARPAATVVV
jgi:hypothetical protein